ncbi:MAG TPA: hypothetical protein VF029_00860 [Actinomycetota bacterium]
MLGALLAFAGPACAGSADVLPACPGDPTILVLAAQAVPSATLLPCLDQLPAGWSFGGSETLDGRFRFWLDSDRAGFHAVQVTLAASCDTSGAIEVTPDVDEVGTRRFERPLSLPPDFEADRYYTFAGGCVEVEFRFASGADPTLVLQANQALGFRPRQAIVDDVAESGLILCGAGAPPCPGGD